MGIFNDGDEEDELFDLFMLNEIHKDSIKGSSKGRKMNSSGGCLMSLLVMVMVPIGIIIGVFAAF
ncbi:hypothetical protein [Butyrivibrio fibrisolvens]|uniref:hypothetical protein n=1 Tax=Butyrivibrio fibrisolvens TaxID=831 RepID=UPI000420127E|nr:hypothetical protein [Butyrivibrio fibrisolvens]